MSGYIPLPGMEPLVLTQRQAQALAIIRSRGPIRSEDLGAELYPRVHELDRARSYGRSVGEALAARGFVHYVRGEGWVDAARKDVGLETGMLAPDEELPF